MSTNSLSYTGILSVFLLLLAVGCGGEAETDGDTSTAAVDTARPTIGETPAPTDRLNLNTATEEEFLTIPAVGENMVHEFFEYRPYTTIQQFRQEIGKYVDEEQVAAYEQYVFVPIDPNESNAATLQQIPGLDESDANELIAGRPYESSDAFLEALGEYVSGEQVSTAKQFLAQ